ncbi:MAG: oxidoreductase [Actinobacteria bacterium 13_1_20CM_3_68_9]|nr:MAG: oxidoreductase [Actinobacteria bacterium 13_1_20CM_3_68_9]
MASTTTDASAAGAIVLGGDLEVCRLGFGAMRLTGEGIWGPPADREVAKAVLRRAVELGINFIDTADSYGPEVSEELIAEALHPYPEGLVIATKGGLTRPGPGRWERDGSPEHLREACEGSLRRLRLERIDVYQLHAVDRRVPLEESVGTLAELREEGKIARVGLSNVDEAELERAREIVPVVSVQNRYSVAERQSEPVLDRCERERLAFIPWGPLRAVAGSRDGAIGRVADAHGATELQVALAWLLARSQAMLPIPGTSSVEHLEENVAAAGLRLSEEEFGELTALAA